MDTSRAALLGKRINDARTQKGWTQVDLAREAQVTKGYVSKIESGKAVKPSEEELARVLRVLGFASVDALLTGERAVPGENVGAVVAAGNREHSAWEELPVFDGLRAAGIMTGAEQWPEPTASLEPPDEFKDEIGPNGIGMIVRGESMAGGLNTPIPDGTVVWFNPHVKTHRRGIVAAAIRESEDGEVRAVVKFHAGDNTLFSLPAPPGSARVPFPIHEIVAMCEVIAVDPQPGRP